MTKLTEHETSVQALINDLDHVVNNVEPADWPKTARAVQEHHTPLISRALLSDEVATAQSDAHKLVEQMTKLEDSTSLWSTDSLRRRVGQLKASFDKSTSGTNGTSRPIFDLDDAKRVTSPTFVPAEPRTRRVPTLSGLFSRRTP